MLERLAEPGALVGPGAPVLHLVDTRHLRVILHLDEAELAALRRSYARVTLSKP